MFYSTIRFVFRFDFTPKSNSSAFAYSINFVQSSTHTVQLNQGDISIYDFTHLTETDLFAAVASSVPTVGGSSCNGSSSTYIRSQFTSNLCPPSNNGAVSGLTGHSIDDLPPPGYAPSEGPPSTIGDLGRILKELLK